jgi:hypothetical protein
LEICRKKIDLEAKKIASKRENWKFYDQNKKKSNKIT